MLHHHCGGKLGGAVAAGMGNTLGPGPAGKQAGDAWSSRGEPQLVASQEYNVARGPDGFAARQRRGGTQGACNAGRSTPRRTSAGVELADGVIEATHLAARPPLRVTRLRERRHRLRSGLVVLRVKAPPPPL